MSEPTRHIIPISGKDSLATALLQTAHDTSLPYEFMFNDCETELPETYEWLEKVEQETGWAINRIGKNLLDIIEGYDVLPAHKMRYCTRQAKIEPMEAWIGEDKAIVYYGLRADEQRTGYSSRGADITPKYPLRDFNIDLQGVWTILGARDLLPPAFFWPQLYESVCDRLGDERDWPVALKPWQRAVLFAGRTRANCYFCFYQRQYEYLWLYDTHPALFDKACRIENEHGGDAYTWREGYHLSDLPPERDSIITRRANEVVKIISSMAQKNLFQESGDTMIATTSCGLLCGK